jgi:hypothetical protein
MLSPNEMRNLATVLTETADKGAGSHGFFKFFHPLQHRNIYVYIDNKSFKRTDETRALEKLSRQLKRLKKASAKYDTIALDGQKISQET